MNRFAVTLAVFVCWVAPGYAQAPLFAPASPIVVGRGSGEIFLADINHDGHLDLLTKHLLTQRLSVQRGDGNGHFAPAAEFSRAFEFPAGAVALGDVNNDGMLDLGVGSKDGRNESVRIFLGSRTGGFSPDSSAPVHVGRSAAGRDYKPSLRFVDLNEDGNLDMISANGRRNALEIFLGDGRGRFSPAPIVGLEPRRSIHSFSLGDIDGDGHLDLVTSSSGRRPDSDPGRVATRRGDGKGRFAAAAGPTLSVPPDPRVAALADVNGDGRSDIVLSYGRTDILSILLNDGQGAFPSRLGPAINIGFPGFEVVAVDVNGDKKVDLVVATVNIATAPFESKIVVLLGDGRGTFGPSPGSPFPVGPGAYRLAVGDVNEDGKLDIAASSFESNAVTLLLGR